MYLEGSEDDGGNEYADVIKTLKRLALAFTVMKTGDS